MASSTLDEDERRRVEIEVKDAEAAGNVYEVQGHYEKVIHSARRKLEDLRKVIRKAKSRADSRRIEKYEEAIKAQRVRLAKANERLELVNKLINLPRSESDGDIETEIDVDEGTPSPPAKRSRLDQPIKESTAQQDLPSPPSSSDPPPPPHTQAQAQPRPLPQTGPVSRSVFAFSSSSERARPDDDLPLERDVDMTDGDAGEADMIEQNRGADDSDDDKDDDELDDGEQGWPKRCRVTRSETLVQQQPTPPPSPPRERSRSRSASPVKPARRRSTRMPKQVEHFGKRLELAHVTLKRPADEEDCVISGEKRSGIGKGKTKDESEPTFVTPQCAATVRRFDSLKSMIRCRASLDQLDDQNKADRAVYENLLGQRKKWKSEPVELSVPVASSEQHLLLDYGKRSSRTVEIFQSANVGGKDFRIGDYVVVAPDSEDDNDKVWFGRIQFFHRKPEGQLKMHLVWLTPSTAVFGHAAHPRHLLFFDIGSCGMCSSVEATSIISQVDVVAAGATDKKASPDQFLVSRTIHDDKSTSSPPDFDANKPRCDDFGIAACPGCEDKLEWWWSHSSDPEDGDAVPRPTWRGGSTTKFTFDGHDYRKGDCVYLAPSDDAESHWVAKPPYRLARLVEIVDMSSGEQRPILTAHTHLKVVPFLRLGHVRKTSTRRERDVLVTEVVQAVSLDSLRGVFKLKRGVAPVKLDPTEDPHVFFADSIVPAGDGVDSELIDAVWSSSPTLLEPHKRGAEIAKLVQPVAADYNFDEPVVLKEHHVQEIKGVSLYSGGLDTLSGGLVNAMPEVKLIAAIECDEDAAKVHALNHPGVPVIIDKVDRVLERATSADATEEEKRLLDVGLICGGPPCQLFSTANKAPRDMDERVLQPFVALAFAAASKAEFALFENVEGLLKFKVEEQGDLFGALRDTAVLSGFDVRASVLPAADFGLAQMRPRVFLQLTRFGLPVPATPTPTHSFTASAPFPLVISKEAFKETKTRPAFDAVTWQHNGVAGPEGSKMDGSSYHVCFAATEKEWSRIRQVGQYDVAGDWGNWKDISEKSLPQAKATKRSSSYYGRIPRDGVSHTITTNINTSGWTGARLHYEQYRLLSLAEGLAAQGAPQTLELFLEKGLPLTKQEVAAAWRYIGNAVAQLVAEALGREQRKARRLAASTSSSTSSASSFHRNTGHSSFSSINSASKKEKGKGKAKEPSPSPTLIISDSEDDEDAVLLFSANDGGSSSRAAKQGGSSKFKARPGYGCGGAGAWNDEEEDEGVVMISRMKKEEKGSRRQFEDDA
ncbi:hypothetical protein JCM8097_008982 [Rhodosporidiobolus ruineniae]